MTNARTPQIATTILATLACLAALYAAQEVLAPVVLAFVIGVILSPISRRIDLLGAPAAASAFITLATIIGLILGLLVLLEPVFQGVIDRAPIIWREVRETVAGLQSMIHGLDQMTDEVNSAINEGNDAPAERERFDLPSITDALVLAPGVAASMLIFAGTLYFFLLSRREVYDWISRLGMGLSVKTLLAAERQVSRYFLTITLINAGLGASMALALWLIGMPFAPLWGFAVFVANFILYLGPAVIVVTLGVAGTVAFDGAFSFLPAAIFLALNLIEAQFVTPSLIGQQMKVNALLVFLSLVFWLWLWGPVGGIIAIPLLVWALTLHHAPRVKRDAPPQ